VIVTAAAFNSTSSAIAFMSVAVSPGPVDQPVPGDRFAFQVQSSNTMRASATDVLTGLPANTPLTFTAKYREQGNATGTWSARDITVVPLPGPVVTTGG
jgi:hypothetical protein